MVDGAVVSERRSATRVVPSEPVMVALENGEGPVARGVVANISETGACVRTDIGFPPGDELLLQLDFPREKLPVTATGRVVWQRGTSGESGGGLGHGLRWTYDGPHRARLRLLIRAMAG